MSLHSTVFMQPGLVSISLYSNRVRVDVHIFGMENRSQSSPIRLLIDRSRFCRLVMFAQLEGNKPAQHGLHAARSAPQSQESGRCALIWHALGRDTRPTGQTVAVKIKCLQALHI